MSSRLKPSVPSPKKSMPASSIRLIVGAAPPEVTMSPFTGWTMPMSLNRIDRIGPALIGSSE